jgi:hypothetical protein
MMLVRTHARLTTKNWTKTQFMSSQSFHRTPYGRVREIIVQAQLELENPKLFDPIAQELYRLLPAIIHTQLKLNRCQNSALVSTCRKELNQPTKQGRCAPGESPTGEVNHGTGEKSEEKSDRTRAAQMNSTSG